MEDDPEIQVVGEAGDGLEAVQLARMLAPQVVVMDLTMPVMDGIEATKQIVQEAPETAVLMLSMHSGTRSVRDAFAAGALGYVVKRAVDLDLAHAVKQVAMRRRVLEVGDESR